MDYCLIVDANETSPIKMSDLVDTELPVCVVRWPDDQTFLTEVKNWVVYLPDEQLRDCIHFAETANCVVHLLAHPGARHSLRGFCYASKREPFTEAFLQRPSIAIDLLRCNGNLVLNKVVAGKAFNYQPGGHASNFWQRLKTVWYQFRHLREYRPQIFNLSTDSNHQIETAAVGIASTGHVLNSSLSRSLLTENYANDGLFYALVVAPKSLVQMLKHLAFESFSRGSRQPGFIGVLRVRNLKITSPEPFECHLDEQSFTTDLLELDIVENALQLAVSPDSPFLKTGVRHKEIRRVQHLPSAAESVKALSGDPLPWVTHAATDDFKELYLTLRENAQISTTFLVFMVLSALLASFGLYADSAPVIIGAMILAPLMAPIISLSMALARQDINLMHNSTKTLVTGLCVAMGFAMLLSFMLPMHLETTEISARLRPTLLDLGVAIISGIAGAYAYARVDAAKSLAGVAIAVALVPPLAVTGIGLGWMSPRIAFGALLLFLTNLAGIVFAASTTFLLLGYAPFSRARRGIVLALIAVMLVSVPLGISFRQLSKEAAIVDVVDELRPASVDVRSIRVLSTGSPIRIRMEMVSQGAHDTMQIRRLKQQLSEALATEVELEVSWINLY